MLKINQSRLESITETIYYKHIKYQNEDDVLERLEIVKKYKYIYFNPRELYYLIATNNKFTNTNETTFFSYLKIKRICRSKKYPNAKNSFKKIFKIGKAYLMDTDYCVNKINEYIKSLSSFEDKIKFMSKIVSEMKSNEDFVYLYHSSRYWNAYACMGGWINGIVQINS